MKQLKISSLVGSPVRVYFDSDNAEYIVTVKGQSGSTYFTEDRNDALSTAQYMRNHCLDLSPPDTKTASAPVVTTPAKAGRVGAPCLFPQPRFTDCGSIVTGDNYAFVCSSVVRDDYDYRDFTPIDACRFVPLGGTDTVRCDGETYAMGQVSRGRYD